MARAWSLGSLMSIAAAVFAAGCSALSNANSSSMSVTGFQDATDQPGLIHENAHALRTVGVDGATLGRGGRTVTLPAADAERQLRQAHADNVRAELLISNAAQQAQLFSEPTVHDLLSRPANLQAVVGRVAALVRAQGWNGLCVDFESLRARDRSGLIVFLGALRRAMPAQAELSITIPNATSPGEFAADGYDLAPIARTVDRVVLLAYDEHAPGEAPGPIGALSWQRAGLDTALRTLPAAKLDLGVAGYGYVWRPHSTFHVSDAQARHLVGATHAHARYEPSIGEWTARLPDGSTMWWSDARSYQRRIALARSYRLHGLAVWSLGLSDPIAAASAG